MSDALRLLSTAAGTQTDGFPLGVTWETQVIIYVWFLDRTQGRRRRPLRARRGPCGSRSGSQRECPSHHVVQAAVTRLGWVVLGVRLGGGLVARSGPCKVCRPHHAFPPMSCRRAIQLAVLVIIHEALGFVHFSPRRPTGQ